MVRATDSVRGKLALGAALGGTLLVLGAAASGVPGAPGATSASGAAGATGAPRAPVASGAVAATETRADDGPTFSRDLAPIVYATCTECHRAGGVGPFPLVSYRDLRKRGRMVTAVVEDRYMPPWHPVEGHGEFVGARVLSEEQIATFGAWVDAGMPEGDPADLPAVPQFVDGWRLGEPDVVLRPPNFDVPAGGPDIYYNFHEPLEQTEDRWITAIDVRPSGEGALHHVLHALIKPDPAAPPEAGFAPTMIEQLGQITVGLGGWAVGQEPSHLPLGTAKFAPAGSHLLLQTHFHPIGKAVTESYEVGVYFKDEEPERTLVMIEMPPRAGVHAGIDIPPGDPAFRIEEELVLPVDTLLFTVGGHAHYLGREMQVTVTRPGVEPESIFYIDDWAFDWQQTYQWREPVRLPAGTKLETLLIYDNSSANPNNPFDPPQRIRWGFQSTEEMGSIGILAVAEREEDTIALDDAYLRYSAKAVRPLRRIAFETFSALDPERTGRIARELVPQPYLVTFDALDADKDQVLVWSELREILRPQGDAFPLPGGKGRKARGKARAGGKGGR